MIAQKSQIFFSRQILGMSGFFWTSLYLVENLLYCKRVHCVEPQGSFILSCQILGQFFFSWYEKVYTVFCQQGDMYSVSNIIQHAPLDPEKYRKRFLFSVSPFVNYFWVLPMPSVRFVSGRHQLRKHKLRQQPGVCSKTDEKA